MIGRTNTLETSSSSRWSVIPGARHDGWPVLFDRATGDIAADCLQEGRLVSLPAAAEAAIRQQFAPATSQ